MKNLSDLARSFLNVVFLSREQREIESLLPELMAYSRTILEDLSKAEVRKFSAPNGNRLCELAMTYASEVSSGEVGQVSGGYSIVGAEPARANHPYVINGFKRVLWQIMTRDGYRDGLSEPNDKRFAFGYGESLDQILHFSITAFPESSDLHSALKIDEGLFEEFCRNALKKEQSRHLAHEALIKSSGINTEGLSPIEIAQELHKKGLRSRPEIIAVIAPGHCKNCKPA